MASGGASAGARRRRGILDGGGALWVQGLRLEAVRVAEGQVGGLGGTVGRQVGVGGRGDTVPYQKPWLEESQHYNTMEIGAVSVRSARAILLIRRGHSSPNN